YYRVKTDNLVNNEDSLSDSDDNLEFKLLPLTETSVPNTPFITEDKTLIFRFFYITEIVDTIFPSDSDSEYDSAEHIIFDQLNHLSHQYYYSYL
ncbi:3725_t:CDS:2, partial [Funneliformis mosseae]